MDGTVLTVENVSKMYSFEGVREVAALKDVSFEVPKGAFVSIIGPSGCGKSTLLEIIGGLKSKTGGRIFLKGKEIDGVDPSVKIVFQYDTTLPWRSTLGNVEFGLEIRGMSKNERQARCREMIDLVGLSGFEGSYPGELSGGMRQRVAIARTLVMDPEILLMDEPFGALDEQTRLILGEELLGIWSRLGQTILFVTHSISEAVLLSDVVVVMSSRPGTIREIVRIDMDRPRQLGDDKVNRVVQNIWDMLREEVWKNRSGRSGNGEGA